MRLYQSKAPLRLGLAGGGTDVAPYCTVYGGAVVNATIQLYAHAQIAPTAQPTITLLDNDSGDTLQFAINTPLPTHHTLPLHAAVYNAVLHRFGKFDEGMVLSTSVDVPIGSGLGTSSTLVVAMLQVFLQWLKQSLSPLEIAQLAYEIERNHLGFAGGHQDQYAAAFGGFNFMQFGPGETVGITPIALSASLLQTLQENIVLYYTGQARQSGKIIEEQQANVRSNKQPSIQAMHELKQQALQMKNALQQGHLHQLGHLFDTGFAFKKQMAQGISTGHIETLYAAAMAAGATGGKISGAGGGGFVFFYCPHNSRSRVTETLNSFGGKVYPFQFCATGVEACTI